MLLRDKRGFALSETLVGFILFSSLLVMYLPSYQREVIRLNQLRLRVQQAQVWSDLSRLAMSEDNKEALIEVRKNDYEDQTGNRIINFSCQPSKCWIEFEDGQVFQAQFDVIEGL